MTKGLDLTGAAGILPRVIGTMRDTGRQNRRALEPVGWRFQQGSRE